MSDSSKATDIVMVCVLMISTSADELEPVLELESEPVLALPRLPLVVEPVPLVDDPVLDESEDEDEDEVPVIASPGETSATDATVPLDGAYRRVSRRAVLALARDALAERTLAFAEATFDASVAAFVVEV